MNTIEFESLDINAKVKYLNAKLKEGNTVIRIREDIGISEKYLQKEIKKGGFKYNQKLRQYLPTTGTTTTSTSNTVIRIREDIGISEKYLQKEIKKGGFKYNQKLRQYLPTTGTTTTSTINNNLDVVPNNTLVVDENKMGVLNYLEDNFNILTEFLEKYKSTTGTTTTKHSYKFS